MTRNRKTGKGTRQTSARVRATTAREPCPSIHILGGTYLDAALQSLLPFGDPNLPIPEIDRSVDPNGEIVERITLKDRKTGRVISRQVRRYTPDGKPAGVTEEWFDKNGQLERVYDEVYVNGELVERYDATVENGVRKHGVKEEFEGGVLKKKTVLDVDQNWAVQKRVIEEYEGNKVKKRTIKGPDDALISTFEYDYDSSGKVRRIVERDADGKVVRVTVIDIRLDGSYSVTVTDYATTPAKVTRSEYNANGSPR